MKINYNYLRLDIDKHLYEILVENNYNYFKLYLDIDVK